jgi:hypothetical protein
VAVRDEISGDVHDLEEVTTLFSGERGETPIVQDQQLHPPERLQQPSVAAGATSQAECLEQPGHAVIHDGAVVPARLVPEG